MLPEITPPDRDEPTITSNRLPDAPKVPRTDLPGDRRQPQRHLVDRPLRLPGRPQPRLSSGEISGTPTAAVGDYPVSIDFTDGTGRSRPPDPDPGPAADRHRRRRHPGHPSMDRLGRPRPARRRSGQRGDLLRPPQLGERRHPRPRRQRRLQRPRDDDNAVENVFWPPSSAPAGGYISWVVVYNPCDGPLDWHLTVRRNGVVIINQFGNGAHRATPSPSAPTDGARRPRQAVPTRSYPTK